MKNHYETLGVGENASPEDIKKAYRRKAQKAHPDKPGGDKQTFTELTRAYKTLSDPEARARYDSTGEDGVKPSLEYIAVKVLIGLFNLGLDTHDPVSFVRTNLHNNGKELATKIRSYQKQIEKLVAKRAGLTYKGKGENFFDNVVHSRIEDLEAQVEGAKDAQKVQKLAQALLDDYDFEPADTYAAWLELGQPE